MPRLINRHEWSELEAGLTQRARAIEAFLRDIYGDQRILADGVLPESVILASPGWRAESSRLPHTAVRAPILGFDLVRNEYGGWRVLEDNVRNPSGIGYAIAIRGLMDAVMPDLPRPSGLADPATALERLRSDPAGTREAGDTRGAAVERTRVVRLVRAPPARRRLRAAARDCR